MANVSILVEHLPFIKSTEHGKKSNTHSTVFPDDTTLVLEGYEKSLIAFLRIIENFSKLSGLCLNNKKTKLALWIGSNAGKDLRLCPDQLFQWVQNKIKTLGVWSSISHEETIKLNYEKN